MKVLNNYKVPGVSDIRSLGFEKSLLEQKISFDYGTSKEILVKLLGFLEPMIQVIFCKF